MDEMSEKLKVVKKLVDKFQLPGVCGFLVLPFRDHDVQVILVIDLSWTKKIQARADHIGKGMRNIVKKKLESYLGFEVSVGSMGVNECN